MAPPRRQTPPRRPATRVLHGVTLRRLDDADVPTYQLQHGGDYEIWKDDTDGWIVTRYAKLPAQGPDDVLGHQPGFSSLSQAVLAILGNNLALTPERPAAAPRAYT